MLLQLVLFLTRTTLSGKTEKMKNEMELKFIQLWRNESQLLNLDKKFTGYQ